MTGAEATPACGRQDAEPHPVADAEHEMLDWVDEDNKVPGPRHGPAPFPPRPAEGPGVPARTPRP